MAATRALFTGCMELARQLGDRNASFVISVKLDEDTFFVKSKKGGPLNQCDGVKTKKKYVSPSTRRRNNLRLLAFKARRAANGGCSSTQPGAPPPHPQLGSFGWGGK